MNLKMMPLVSRAFELVIYEVQRAAAIAALQEEFGVPELTASNAYTTGQHLLLNTNPRG